MSWPKWCDCFLRGLNFFSYFNLGGIWGNLVYASLIFKIIDIGDTADSLFVSVMHSASFVFRASSDLNLLNTKTHIHSCRGHADLLAHRMRLDFQFGFVLQLSLLSTLPPVSVNVIRLVCLLPACCSLCFSHFSFAVPPSAHTVFPCAVAEVLPCCVHLGSVLIHCTKHSPHDSPFPIFVIESQSLLVCSPLLPLLHFSLS